MSAQQDALHPKDNWGSGDAYESYVGRWSRRVGSQFAAWLAVPPGGVWLDVGCGTGALTNTILREADPRAVKGIDAAAGFVDFVRGHITDPRATFEVGDAQAMPVESQAYDAVVSGLVLNFIPQPAQALAEMVRAAKPGGLVGIYVWDYASGMQFMRHFWNAAATLDANAARLDEGRRFPLCSPAALTGLFEEAGLTNVETQPIDIWTVFRDFDDYWTPFLGGQGSAPSYLMSIDTAARTALRERLRAALPFAIDGSIPLIARAWAVRGRASPSRD